MRFGICIDPMNAALCAELGYDYVEGKINALAKLSEDEYEALKTTLEDAKIKMETACLLFPKDMVLLGEEAVSDEQLVAYLDKAFSRMRELDSQVAVFGSGKSRFTPPSMSEKDAFSKLVERTKLIGKVAEKHKITLVVEPLCRKETNLINSLSEGAALRDEVGMDSVKLLADAYHMSAEGEHFDEIKQYGPLAHAHIAVFEKRGYPEEETEEVLSFIKALKASGYNGRLSIEGKSEDWISSSKKALKTLRAIDKKTEG